VATNYGKTQQQQHNFPQIFIPQNTPFENSAFHIPQSTYSPKTEHPKTGKFNNTKTCQSVYGQSQLLLRLMKQVN